MLIFPAPPMIFPKSPLAELGEYATPRRGANRFFCGTSVFGTPASVGYTSPVGAVGYTFDCWPKLKVGIWLYFSDQYCMRSQRTPKLSVRFDRARQLSCANPAAYLCRP